jgi:hypothetical protein
MRPHRLVARFPCDAFHPVRHSTARAMRQRRRNLRFAGSTKLLWIALWKDLLAFLGAFLTVDSLGIDPFAQDIVSYYPCTTASNSAVPSFSRINLFFSGGFLGSVLPAWGGQARNGSFNNLASIMPNFTCTADSCTFAKPYHSVCLCTSCIDVTNEILTECTDNVETGSCNYTLSRNVSGNNGSDFNIVANTTAGYTYKPAIMGTGPSTGKKIQVRYWDVFSIRQYSPEAFSPGFDPGHLTSSLDMVSAWPLLGCRCQVYFCVTS